jgi:hypothetical protein
MRLPVRQLARTVTISLLATIFAAQTSLMAQTHVVSPQDLQREAAAATRTRQQNVDDVRDFLSSPNAEQALRDARMDPAQVKAGVATLGDEELAQLAARSAKAQADFAAGRLSDRDLLWIVVIIAGVIVIIVAVR